MSQHDHLRVTTTVINGPRKFVAPSRSVAWPAARYVRTGTTHETVEYSASTVRGSGCVVDKEFDAHRRRHTEDGAGLA
jgi:hypothetical protein